LPHAIIATRDARPLSQRNQTLLKIGDIVGMEAWEITVGSPNCREATMDIGQWESEIEKALRHCNLEYQPTYRAIALRKLDAHKPLAADMMIAMERYFWTRVCAREVFGPTQRVAQKFGKSLEDNYGLQSGPFMDLARTYWTYKVELQDILPMHYDTWLAQALIAVEFNIAQLFFPTPGPISMPKRMRRMPKGNIYSALRPRSPLIVA
jgi:hypothetical protein